MSYYIFRFPKDMPFLDFASLKRYLDGSASRKIGTTVQVHWIGDSDGPCIGIRLYGLLIALVREDSVTFLPYGDDSHQATTEWIAAIARHNGIAGYCGRRRRRKSDGDGPMTARGMAGVLCFGWEPGAPSIVGQGYPVQLAMREHTLTWYERKIQLEKENA